jgi:hypothetical protein
MQYLWCFAKYAENFHIIRIKGLNGVPDMKRFLFNVNNHTEVIG